VRTAALAALLLLLILPSGASAAAPSGLVGQTLAQVDGVVQTTGGSVSQVGAQVDGAVARTLDGAKQALGGPADPARSVPTPDVEVGQTLENTVTKPAVGAVETVTARPESPGTSGSPPPPASRAQGPPDRHSPSGAHPRSNGKPAPAHAAETAPPTIVTASLDQYPASGPTPNAPRERPAASDGSFGSTPTGPAFGGEGSGGVASAAFSAGALAILLAALFFAASAFRSRLPRFDEVGRPLPLVFALERPG
jgi:hypothetical protein